MPKPKRTPCPAGAIHTRFEHNGDASEPSCCRLPAEYLDPKCGDGADASARRYRYQVVRHSTWIKNEVRAILQAHLIPKCPHVDLSNKRGRDWLTRQPMPDDERAAIGRHVRELDRLGEDLAVLDRDIAQDALEDEAIRRLLTVTDVNLAVAAGLMAAIGSIDRFSTPRNWRVISG